LMTDKAHEDDLCSQLNSTLLEYNTLKESF